MEKKIYKALRIYINCMNAGKTKLAERIYKKYNISME